MNRQSRRTVKHLLFACMTYLILSFSTAVAAETAAVSPPKPGSYCPDTNILLISGEELSASLDQVTRSRAALIGNDRTTAISELISARTTLHLAASRGAAARTILLVDAIIQARAGEDYAQMLTWFPLLKASLQTLSDDAIESAANELIGRAEEIMQGGNEGDPIELLKQVRHMLACDGLDIPLQEAVRAQDALMKQLSQGDPDKNTAYDQLLNSLRGALLYTLEKH